MTITAQETRTLARVLEMLGSGEALSQDLEDYVVGYHILGNLVADASANHEGAELSVKLRYAEAFAEAKSGDNKVSDLMARAVADIAVHPLRLESERLREKYMKLKHTREAVQEVIWAQKYLGRNGG